jgi:glutamate/tyrosine decarboxylase-like PLP-dependent enzyme
MGPEEDEPMLATLLRDAADRALAFLDELPERPVAPRVDLAGLRAALGGELAEGGVAADEVLAALDGAARPALMANAGPRFFGFVIGGTQPVSIAADWLVSAWDQNAGLYVLSPAVSVIEETAARWLLSLLGLPAAASVGFVTGGQMASFTCLAAARHEVLRRVGWDVDRQGLVGSPGIDVVASDEAHVTIHRALRYLGIGTGAVRPVATDAEGCMLPASLAEVLAGATRPTIVCAQAGDVNSGACDRFADIVPLVRAHGGWLHVDGGFGLWASAAPDRRHLVAGIADADSWSTDAHKWLNVPYDSGLAFCAHPADYRDALSVNSPYLSRSGEAEGDFLAEWVPEISRRARGVPIYAVLRALGRQGVADLVERSCRLARRMADLLAADPAVSVINDVPLNQVLARCAPPGASDDVADAVTRSVIAAVQGEGTCWLGGTTWRGRAAIRISVSNWATTEADIDRSAAVVLAAVRRLSAAPPEVVIPLRPPTPAGEGPAGEGPAGGGGAEPNPPDAPN